MSGNCQSGNTGPNHMCVLKQENRVNITKISHSVPVEHALSVVATDPQITSFTCLLGRLNETNKQNNVTIKF